MWHSDTDLFHSALGRTVEDRIEQWDEGLSAFEGEAFLSDVLGLQK